MNDQDRKAREMLADEYERGGLLDIAARIRRHDPLPAGWQDDCLALRAIRRALELAAPEGRAPDAWRWRGNNGGWCYCPGNHTPHAGAEALYVATAPKPAATEVDAMTGDAEIRWVVDGQVYGRPTGPDALEYANANWTESSDNDSRIAGLANIRRVFASEQAKPAADGVTEAFDEQAAFVEWATANHHDMSRHPLHFLFLDRETNIARQAWKGCIAALAAARKGEG
jgi:hypothetical protein